VSREDLATGEDESFGPGTDLVVSLFAMLLVVAVLWWYQGRVVARLEAFAHARQLAQVKGQLRRATQELEELEQAVSKANRRTQLYEFLDSVSDAPYFDQNDTHLTDQAEEVLDLEVENFVSALSGGRYNQIQVIGHASAESATGILAERQRRNLVLSLARAAAVADYLYERGIPYECISVSGFGRSQSRVLADWLDSHPGAGIDDWDESGQYSQDTMEEELASERRVEIWGIWHPSSQCDLSRGQ
jgi:outer membrane protein OmpA-like peptidoglycan-associated protein